MPMSLNYLDFDYSESGDDDTAFGTFDALASVGPAQVAAVHAEISEVLGWAHAAFGEPGPVADGFDWDCDLQALREYSVADLLRYDPGRQSLVFEPGTVGAPRHTIGLSLSGSASFCEALRERFGLD